MGTAIEPVGGRRPTQIELDAHALWLQSERDFTYQRIADEMGSSVSTAHRRVRRAWARLPGPKAGERKAAALAELDRLRVHAHAVLERPHFALTQGGKVATFTLEDHETGTVREIPIPDDGPVLDAIRSILSIQERETKYEGNDAPTKRSYEVMTKDAFVASMEEMVREMESGDGKNGVR